MTLKKNAWFTGLMSLLLLISVGCNDDDEPNVEDSEAIGQVGEVEPQLEDIPDVVATVNGEDITKDFFAMYYVPTLKRTVEQQTYQEEEEKNDEEALRQQIQDDTLELLIQQQLLLQEAKSRNITVEEEVIHQQLQSFKQQYESEEAFQAALQEENFTKEELEQDIKIQIMINQLMEDELKNVEVSEEQTRELYEELNEMQGENEENMPSYEELQPQLEQQILQQLRFEKRQELVEKLRKEGEIKVYL